MLITSDWPRSSASIQLILQLLLYFPKSSSLTFLYGGRKAHPVVPYVSLSAQFVKARDVIIKTKSPTNYPSSFKRKFNPPWFSGQLPGWCVSIYASVPLIYIFVLSYISGDDHDYCDVVHTIPSTSYANPSPLSVHEVSVKSFSMGMGIQQPGYQLLSLYNPSKFSKIPGEETTFHRPCVLPNQIYIYTHLYLPLLVLTVLSIFGPLAWRRLMFGRGAIRPQAKTNGLPIHHRGRQHRKSLSRTLMFHKSSTSLSGDSASSSEEGRSDEEAGHRLVSQHSRRSGSVSFGVGPDHMENGGYNSPTSVLSYHSPVDSGHEDDRISHPFPASQFGTMSATPVDITTSARRAGGTKVCVCVNLIQSCHSKLDTRHLKPSLLQRPPPPTRYPSAGPSANTGGHRARLFGRWARDGCLMSCLRAVLERRTVERCEKVLSRSGWGRSGFSREICPSELRRACGDFGQVMSIVCLVYATIWLWFWW